MQTSNRKFLFEVVNSCIKKAREVPTQSIEELEKVVILADILESLTNFETKLIDELDVE